jgi:cell division protease FtsH
LRRCSEALSAKIDLEVQQILTSAYLSAKELLKSHRHDLERVAGELVENETLDGRTFAAIMEAGSLASSPTSEGAQNVH